jgi:hypothetical protein
MQRKVKARLGHLWMEAKEWVAKDRRKPCQTCQREAQRRAWVDNLLGVGGWVPVSSQVNDNFSLLRKQKALYSLIESSEAWKDFNFRMTQLRDGTRLAIERGVVDNHGKTHEPEQRAVLYVLEQLMGYVPSINRDFEQMMKSLEADEARAGAPVYGDDQPMDLTSFL